MNVFLILLLFAGGARAEDSLSQLLGRWGISVDGLPALKLRRPPAAGSEEGITEAEAEGGGRLLRLTRMQGVTAETAARYSEGALTEIEAMYDRRFDGYFPPQSKGHACPKNMRPVRKAKKNGKTEVKGLVSMANERHVTGICLERQAKFRLVVAIAYCAGKKELFDLRYFVPRKEFSEKKDENAVLSLRCEKESF